MNNILADLPDASNAEVFEVILKEKGIKVERIVSCGQTTPEGKWLSSPKNEWVLVVEGAAKLVFQDKDDIFDLVRGDTLLIPANTAHRVEWTDETAPTIWLALHY